MTEDEKWELVHDYVRAVNAELLEPLVCSHCFMQLYLKATEDFEPSFYCYFCETKTTPTLRTLSKIKKLLKEIPVE